MELIEHGGEEGCRIARELPFAVPGFTSRGLDVALIEVAIPGGIALTACDR